MNSSIYIFGKRDTICTQYPDDYTWEIFTKFVDQASADSQIIIHRERDLMYYGYVRKLDVVGQYMGFCVLLNGVMFTQLNGLFPIFEEAVADMVSHEELLHLEGFDALLSFAGPQWTEKQREVGRVSALIREKIQSLEPYTEKLPPVNYALEKDSYRSFVYSDEKAEFIVEAAAQYGYTCIRKSGNSDAPLLKELRDAYRKRNKPTVNEESEHEYARDFYPIFPPPPPSVSWHGHQHMFSHPFSFCGRIRRLEYWISYFIYYVWTFLSALISSIVLRDSDSAVLFYCMLMIPAVWFMYAQGAKRCHDRDNSGWYQLIPFYRLWMLFGDGERRPNKYGFDPKR